MEDERQIAALTKKVTEGRVTRLSESVSDVPEIVMGVEDLPASKLNQKMVDAVAAIRRVGSVSKGLNGVCKKALKEAAVSILESAEVLLARTTTEETALLRMQNAKLAAQMDQLRKEHEELKAEMVSFRREQLRREVGLPELQPPTQSLPQESALTRIVQREMASLNARFSVLEGRILRPPLAADHQSTPTVSYATKAATPRANHQAQAASPGVSSTKPKGKSKKNKQLGDPVASDAPPKQAIHSAPKSGAQEESEWTVVGCKNKKKKERHSIKQRAKKQAARSRAPRSTAVVLTLQPGAVERGLTYAGVLTKAKENISLSDLGISGIRCKTTVTGARLLEIPGATSGPRADALAEKLRTTLGTEEVKVSRPTKCADLRISGLDDSVTPDEVAAAIAKAGNCPPDQIKTGIIRRGFSGLGTVQVSCPVAAANKISNGKRLLVGWVSAQVSILKPKPLRCYRCLDEGHVGVQCTSEVDRSQLCFRCGQPGHKADSCNAKPHCVLCGASGKPADHRTGSKACARPKAKQPRRSKDATLPVHPPAKGGIADAPMEAASSLQPIHSPAVAVDPPRTEEEITVMDI
uniref:CCHC-type domain-containing protein n=1 Tax=Heliothis virescens TaxID=7102 RepID=A0A2A4JDP3_HELVI